jgi:5'-3' exonuclease
MDFIHRQRTNDSHVPNTQYVIYVRVGELTFTRLSVNSRMLRMLIPLCSLLQLTTHIPSTSGRCVCAGQRHRVPNLWARRSLCRSIRDQKTSSTGEIHFPRVAILRGFLESELNVNNTPAPVELGIAHILCWKRLAAFAIT